MRRIAAWTVLVAMGSCAAVLDAETRPDRWSPPAATTRPAVLPKLDGSIQVDGDLSDWQGGASVPMGCRSYLAKQVPGHEWKGPMDASMEAHVGWTEEGLCLGAVVVDDDVRNNRGKSRPERQDCVEFIVDARPAGKLLAPEWGPNVFQVYVVPPTEVRKALVMVNPRDGQVTGLRGACRRTAGGYTVEMVVPWKALPGFEARDGAVLGLKFALDDYDADDGKTEQPVVLRYQADANVRNPSGGMRWRLAERMPSGEDVVLGPQVAIDVPAVIRKGTLPTVMVRIAEKLMARTGVVRVTIAGADRQMVLRETRIRPSGQLGGTNLEWPDQDVTDGCYSIVATLLDRNDEPMGTASRAVLVVRDVVERALERIEKARVAELARDKPFKAAAWLGAAATIERLKRGIENADLPAAAQAAREVEARMDLLEGREPALARANLCDLLALTAEPDSQVVVEYARPDQASVTFTWGAVPLVSVLVRQHADPEAARATLREDGMLPGAFEQVQIGGMPGRIGSRLAVYEALGSEAYTPDGQVLAVDKQRQSAVMLDVREIAWPRVEAIAILPDCPEAIRQAVEAAAARRKCPLVGVDEAFEKDRLLLAGDPRHSEVAERLQGFDWSSASLREVATRLDLVAADRVITVHAPSGPVARRVASLVAAGKAIQPWEVDELRAAVVQAASPRAEVPPPVDGMELFCGDLHMHTFYSDGTPSPVGLMLQAMYCGMDYAVITDHNTLEGAQLAARGLREHRVVFPVTVGQEITGMLHMNAFPLDKLVPWTPPPAKIVAAAREQEAMIQWNHPGFPQTAWATAQMPKGLAGTGFDAWEHLPARYEQWNQAGEAPLLTGTTDTHDGTFGGYIERTIVLAPAADGASVARAIRDGRVVALLADGKRLLYNSDDMVGRVWAALAEGQRLKALKAARLQAVLQEADVAGLIRASDPRPARP